MNEANDSIGVGVMGCSSFALRAMVPALKEVKGIELRAMASRDLEKAKTGAEPYQVKTYEGYGPLLEDSSVDLIYMPLPTGLHREWVLRALEAGKHVLVEKSCALNLEDAQAMVECAERHQRLLRENFLFLRHSQYTWARKQLSKQAIGDLCFFRAAFTFPALAPENFRYQSETGGGALLDAGAYMSQSALAFLEEPVKVLTSTSQICSQRKIDLRGTASVQDARGVVGQLYWGFDTHYQCSWDIHGIEGRMIFQRALTPPPDCQPEVRVEMGFERKVERLPADNHYFNQWSDLVRVLRGSDDLSGEWNAVLRQAEMLEAFRQFHQAQA